MEARISQTRARVRVAVDLAHADAPSLVVCPRNDLAVARTWPNGSSNGDSGPNSPWRKSPAAFKRRCIPPECVVRGLHMPNMRPPHALSGGRLAALGATRGFTTGCEPSKRLADQASTCSRDTPLAAVDGARQGVRLLTLSRPRRTFARSCVTKGLVAERSSRAPVPVTAQLLLLDNRRPLEMAPDIEELGVRFRFSCLGPVELL